MGKFLRATRDKAAKVMDYLVGGFIMYMLLKSLYDTMAIVFAPLF